MTRVEVIAVAGLAVFPLVGWVLALTGRLRAAACWFVVGLVTGPVIALMSAGRS